MEEASIGYKQKGKKVMTYDNLNSGFSPLRTLGHREPGGNILFLKMKRRKGLNATIVKK